MDERRKNKPRIRALPLSSPSVQSVCSVRNAALSAAVTAAAYTNDFDDPPLPAGRAARPRRRMPDCPIWPEATAAATARPPTEVRPRPTAPLCLFSSPTRPPTTPLACSLTKWPPHFLTH